MVRQVSLETAEKTNSRIRLSKTRNITMIIFKKANTFAIILIGKKRGDSGLAKEQKMNKTIKNNLSDLKKN